MRYLDREIGTVILPPGPGSEDPPAILNIRYASLTWAHTDARPEALKGFRLVLFTGTDPNNTNAYLVAPLELGAEERSAVVPLTVDSTIAVNAAIQALYHNGNESSWRLISGAIATDPDTLPLATRVLADRIRLDTDAAAAAAAAAQTAANSAATAAAYADRLARSGHNLIKNGNSEDPSPSGPEALNIDNRWPYSGTKHRLLVPPTATTITGYFVNFIPCSPGEKYIFRAMTACDPYSGSFRRIGIDWHNAAGSYFDGVYSAERPSDGWMGGGPGSYREQVVEGVAPEGACFMRVVCIARGATASAGFASFDNLYAERVQNGAISAQAAANNAASAAAYADALARSSHNLIKNGNSEDPNPTGLEAAWISDSGAYTGTRCRALTVPSAGGYPQETVGEAPCDPGDQFVFTAWGKQADAHANQYIFIEFLNAAGGRAGIDLKLFPATTAYTLAEVSGEAPAGAVKVRFVIYVDAASVTTYYWDCLYAARKVSAGMLEADILKAMLIRGEVIETPNYVPGSAGVAPVGVKISGVPFAATLKDGSTLQVNMELGTSASIGGERVQTILDALFANQAEFQAGQSGTWTAPKSGWLEVLMCGGGGSGAHSADGSFPVCGGGGAGVLKYTIWVTKGQQITYSVGSGGAGGGNDGGDTTFGAATAKGGTRGGMSNTSGGPGGAVIPPTSLGGQIAGASAGVSTSITTGFDVLAACPGAGGGNAITYGGGTTWFAPWTSGDPGTGGSSGLGRGGQSGTAPTGYGAGSGARKNTSSASLPGGPGYLRLRW